MSDFATIDAMKKQIKTVPIHARLPESDVAVVDRAAEQEPCSRSNMVARIIREWIKRQLSQKKS